MGKLKLEDIVGYLPYRLEGYADKEINFKNGSFIRKGKYTLSIGNISDMIDQSLFERIKPVLKPLTYDTIESYFIPLWDSKDEDVIKYMDADFLHRFDTEIDYLQDVIPEYLPLGVVNLFHKHHVDFKDLIKKGIAVDANNLKV